MIINKKKPWYIKVMNNFDIYSYHNDILENYFEKNTTWQKDEKYKKTFGKTVVKVFKEHYQDLKPSLNEINTFNKLHLRHHNMNQIKTDVLIDANTLLSRPFNPTGRQEYLNSVEPCMDVLHKIDEYRDVLFALNPNEISRSLPLSNAADFYTTSENAGYIKGCFIESIEYIDKVDQHPAINATIDLLSTLFRPLTTHQTDILTYYFEHHEKFSMLTMEPYIIPILGITGFLKVFVSFHREGVFSYVMHEALSRSKASNNTFNTTASYVLQQTETLVNSALPYVQHYNKAAFLTTILYKFARPFFVKNPLSLPEVSTPNVLEPRITICEDAAKRIFNNRGLNDPLTNSIIDSTERVGFTLGRFLGTFGSSFAYGVASRHKELIEAGAKTVDQTLNNRKK
jgi:hypothetical protein